MIQLLTQTTEFYCSTEKEAEEILSSRKEEPDDENEYHEMFDEDLKVIEHVERIDE